MALTLTVHDGSKEREISKIVHINNSATPFSFVNFSPSTFRNNIRAFLHDYSHTENYTIDDNIVRCIFLATQGVIFPFYVIEELVSSSPYPPCDFCRCVGWGHHYVSKRRYHLLIPEKNKWDYTLTTASLNLTSHLMHGVIHCNGFGHLLCINRDDSPHLSGDKIMDIWDNLCSILQTRKISLDDISRKKSMELRLFHGVAYGRTWFGKWGYRFSHGSFGVTKVQYRRAIHILSSIELDKIIQDFSGTKNERVIQMIIHSYREASEDPLVTLSDLLQFMLAFSSKALIERKTAMALVSFSSASVLKPICEDEDTKTNPVCSSPDKESDHGRDFAIDTALCAPTITDRKYPECDSFDAFRVRYHSRWNTRRLEEAADVVIKVLEERKRSISRQELRDAVRLQIGDTGLIDFLLKHIDKVQIGDQIVQRFTNRSTRMLEFSLLTNARVVQEPKKKKKAPETKDWKSTTPGLDAYEDILYLYQNLLFCYPDFDIINKATEIILNCKSFIKEWPLPSFQEQNLLTVSCQVLPNHEELLRHFTRPLPPGELVVVPETATIRELKSAAEQALKDTYCIMETFEVLEIRNKDLEKIDDSSSLTSEAKTETEFQLRVFGLDTSTTLRYEGGSDDWIVDCKCGARDDDGERMVACDFCRVWYHTLCNSIEDDEAVPSVFLCSSCCKDSLRPKKRKVTVRLP